MEGNRCLLRAKAVLCVRNAAFASFVNDFTMDRSWQTAKPNVLQLVKQEMLPVQ